MKVLIIGTTDDQGGAARAALRLHQSLLKQGVESQMLVQQKYSDLSSIEGLNDTKIQKILGVLRPYIDTFPIRRYKNRTSTLFSAGWFGSSSLISRINRYKPDIVHLHWVCGGMLKIEDLAKIEAPIIWSLHDMWAFTGGCHYDENCSGYLRKCGNCKVLGSEKENDLSRRIFKRKLKTFSEVNNLTIVGLSEWINNASKSSSLLNRFNHINLPNPIDTSLFKPMDKTESRKVWNLPLQKKLVLFGAMGATSDPRKGYIKLINALKLLDDPNIELVVFGAGEGKYSESLGLKTHYTGKLHDDVSLIALYSAVDVMVVPSLQENLSNVIVECLACKTPVVTFDIGGNGDMIVHKQNGFLARPFSATDFQNGILWVLESEDYSQLCENARNKVLTNFDDHLVSSKYIDLYKRILN